MARIRGIGTAQHARRRAIRPNPQQDPLTIFGVDLELWLRSDELVVVSGGLVDSWGDLSGKGNDFSEGAFRLIYNAGNADWGGLPSIDGDGTKRSLLSDSAKSTWKYLHDGTGSFSLVVYRLTSLAGSQELMATATDSGRPGVRISGDRSDSYRAQVQNATAVTISTSIPVVVDTNYYASFAYLDGRPGNEWRQDLIAASLTGNASAAPSSLDPFGNLRIGANVPGSSVFFNGSIVEMMSASVYPTDDQYALVEAYLDARYGLS